MPIQTSYPYGYGVALQGMAYDMTNKDDITAWSTDPIEFGLGVIYDGATDPNERWKIALPSVTGQVFAGVTKYSHKQVSGVEAKMTDLTTVQGARYEAGDDITVRRRGRIYVFSEQAVNPGLPVYLRFAVNGAGTAAGQFRVDADTARADQITQARWVSVTTGSGLAILEINLP